MIKLILVRHGQSVWNLENKFTGWTDVDLSDKGVLEAEKAGKYLNIPQREDIPENIKEQLIVELYSK